MAVQVLSKPEVQRLLVAPDVRFRKGRRDRAFLHILVYGGLRLHEACKLRRDEVHEDGGVMRLVFEGKGGKRRTVTLPEVAAATVRQTLADQKRRSLYVFPSRRSCISVTTGWRLVHQSFGTARLEAWVHPHSLRHTCATLLLRATNGDMRTVQRHLGHSSPATTAKYYDGWDNTDSDRAAAALEKFL